MADAMRIHDDELPAFPPERTPAKGYTYKEYCSWGEDVRCELINGTVYLMSAPTEWHQFVAGQIFKQLDGWLEDKPCRAYIAPFDVRLFPPPGDDNGSDKVVVQPDVLVICDCEKLSDGKSCRGAPDFVVEVVSKGTRGKDFGSKKTLYEKAGVAEYWIVENDAVYRYVPVEGEYQETVYEMDEGLELEVGVLPGCRIGFRRIVKQAL